MCLLLVPALRAGAAQCQEYALQRGDINGDGSINIVDGVYLLNFLYLGGPASSQPHEIQDVNNDNSINLTDAVYLFNYLFDESAPDPAFLTENYLMDLLMHGTVLSANDGLVTVCDMATGDRLDVEIIIPNPEDSQDRQFVSGVSLGVPTPDGREVILYLTEMTEPVSEEEAAQLSEFERMGAKADQAYYEAVQSGQNSGLTGEDWVHHSIAAIELALDPYQGSQFSGYAIFIEEEFIRFELEGNTKFQSATFEMLFKRPDFEWNLVVDFLEGLIAEGQLESYTWVDEPDGRHVFLQGLDPSSEFTAEDFYLRNGPMVTDMQDMISDWLQKFNAALDQGMVLVTKNLTSWRLMNLQRQQPAEILQYLTGVSGTTTIPAVPDGAGAGLGGGDDTVLYKLPQSRTASFFYVEETTTMGELLSTRYEKAEEYLELSGYNVRNHYADLNSSVFREFYMDWKWGAPNIVMMDGFEEYSGIRVGVFDDPELLVDFQWAIANMGFTELHVAKKTTYNKVFPHVPILDRLFYFKSYYSVYVDFEDLHKMGSERSLVVLGKDGERIKDHVPSERVVHNRLGCSMNNDFHDQFTELLFGQMSGDSGSRPIDILSLEKAVEGASSQYKSPISVGLLKKIGINENGVTYTYLDLPLLRKIRMHRSNGTCGDYKVQGDDKLMLYPVISKLEYFGDTIVRVHFATDMRREFFGDKQPFVVEKWPQEFLGAEISMIGEEGGPHWVEGENAVQFEIFPLVETPNNFDLDEIFYDIKVRGDSFRSSEISWFGLHGKGDVEPELGQYNAHRGIRGFKKHTVEDSIWNFYEDDAFTVYENEDQNCYVVQESLSEARSHCQ